MDVDELSPIEHMQRGKENVAPEELFAHRL